jgi:pimeloyl-ACP methyl ester carboxylesterase
MKLRGALLSITLAIVLLTAPFVVTAIEDRYFDSAGVQIRYVEQGSGEPVILVHGYSRAIERMWLERGGIFNKLAETHRVIAFDCRGYGKSDKPHDRAQYGLEMGRDVVRLMDHLELPKAHIMGYSLGGQIVAQLVTKSPERFFTLILGGAPGRFEWSAADQRRVEIEAAEMDNGLLTSQIMRLWPTDQPRPSDDEVRAMSAKRLEGMDPKALAAIRRSNPDQVVRLADLATVKLPTLGIVGTTDPNQKDFQKLKNVMPQLKLVLIQGASHETALEHPEFIKTVKEFLAEHSSQPAK